MSPGSPGEEDREPGSSRASCTLGTSAPTRSASSVTLRIALTEGDPRGVGPEVVAKATRAFSASDGEADLEAHLLVFGSAPEDPGPEAPPSLPRGVERITAARWDGSEASAGAAAAGCLDRAVSTVLDGAADALVTGPVHKPALRAAGWRAPGQTEWLQERTGAPTVGMLMDAERTRLGGPLRVLLATTHLPLRKVAERVRVGLLLDQSRLLARELRARWKIVSPRIGLCGLNPHASDRGLFGDEEARIFEPAVRRLRDESLDVTGPHPADTVFVRALQGEFDAVIAPYHDVGMAPFKAVSFGRGVNVTLGLPFVRTSPDHGTAFDIAGRDRADPTSTLEALRLAVRLAGCGRTVEAAAAGPDVGEDALSGARLSEDDLAGDGFDTPEGRI